MNKPGFDSYIFDMDGTLWDAVDSYALIWNITIDELGLEIAPVTRATLMPLMGTPLSGIYDAIVGDDAIRKEFVEALRRNEDKIMPTHPGTLYDGVRQTLTQLHDGGARLFMVSNCSPLGLPNFLRLTGLAPLFTDYRSYGQNGLEKNRNISDLVHAYGLQSPVYVGDTQGDCDQTHAAGIPFVWAAYGFGGNVDGADYVIQSISELTALKPLK